MVVKPYGVKPTAMIVRVVTESLVPNHHKTTTSSGRSCTALATGANSGERRTDVETVERKASLETNSTRQSL